MPRKHVSVGHLSISKSWDEDKNKEQQKCYHSTSMSGPFGQRKDTL